MDGVVRKQVSNPSQQFYLVVISSVVDLCGGQSKDADKLVATLRGQAALNDSSNTTFGMEIGAVGNK